MKQNAAGSRAVMRKRHPTAVWQHSQIRTLPGVKHPGTISAIRLWTVGIVGSPCGMIVGKIPIMQIGTLLKALRQHFGLLSQS